MVPSFTIEREKSPAKCARVCNGVNSRNAAATDAGGFGSRVHFAFTWCVVKKQTTNGGRSSPSLVLRGRQRNQNIFIAGI